MAPLARLALLTGTALLLLPVLRADPLQTMAHSKPSLIDGFEFVATTESEWTMPPPYSKEDIEIQLYITNRVGRDRAFPTFDTFQLHIKDSAGHELLGGGGRDHTLFARPVLIRAGETYCLCRSASIARDRPDNGKTLNFTFEDGTGSWFTWNGVKAGSYTLSFSLACDGLDSQTQFISKMEKFDWTPYLIWTGRGTTHAAAFTIVDPPSQ